MWGKNVQKGTCQPMPREDIMSQATSDRISLSKPIRIWQPYMGKYLLRATANYELVCPDMYCYLDGRIHRLTLGQAK